MASELPVKCQFVPGYAFGHRQSSALLTLVAPADSDVDAGGARVERLCGLEGVVDRTALPARYPARVAQWIGSLATRLQRDAGIPVFPARRPSLLTHSPDGQALQLVLTLPCAAPDACQSAVAWVAGSLFGGDDDSLLAGLASLRAGFKRFALEGLNQIHFLEAAHELGIPARRLYEQTYCLGQGAASTWFKSTITDKTSGLGIAVAKHKMHCSAVLRAHGIPVPDHILVNSTQEAVAAAHRLGWPVVVKPANLDQGKGVAAGLGTEASVAEAFAQARALSKLVLVERHVHGQDYRMTVMQGRLIKVMHRTPGGVAGDGISSIATLVQRKQAEPLAHRRFVKEGKHRLALDEEALSLLAEQGLAPESVLPEGTFLALRRKSNISTGGTQTVIPVADVHPDNHALACRATEVLGLDIAGVDLLVADIGRSWRECRGAICEVNAQPQIGASTSPGIFPEMLAALVPGGGRIPTYLQVGVNLPPAVQARLAREWAAQTGCNGVSHGRQVLVDGAPQGTLAADSIDAGRRLLIDRRVRSAVVCVTAADLRKFGSPAYGWSAVRVVAPPALDGKVKSYLDLVLAPDKYALVAVEG